jgi:hypothetical protein
MYPTAIAGLVMIFTALRYALAPEAARALVVRRLSILTFFTGTLGFVVGVMKTFLSAHTLPGNEMISAVICGVGESLHNFALALCCLVLTGTAMAIGAARRTSKDPDELIAP